MLSLDTLTLQYILEQLPVPSLSQLLQTCTTLHSTTNNFIHHSVLSTNRDIQIEKFYSRHRESLLPCERRFSQLNWSVREYTLQHYAALECVPDSDYIMRHSLTTCECFGWYGDEKHAVPELDLALQREVVALGEIAFLTFSKLFYSVTPGRYIVTLHFYISNKVKWGSVGAPAVISVNKVKEKVKEKIVCHMMDNTLWRGLVEGKEHPLIAKRDPMITRRKESAEYPANNVGDPMISIREGDWYFMTFPVVLDTQSDLEFKWDDRLNYWYKSGMRYDYVELRREDCKSN